MSFHRLPALLISSAQPDAAPPARADQRQGGGGAAARPELAAAAVEGGGWRPGPIWVCLPLLRSGIGFRGALMLHPQLEEAGGYGSGMAVVVSSSIGGVGRLVTATSWGDAVAGENGA